MIGYKAFDENLQCRGFQFEVGKTYELPTKKEDMRLCSDNVFHFCRDLYDIEKHSDYKLKRSRICEVLAGDVVGNTGKFGTNKLTILREITGEEKMRLLNNGMHNFGFFNVGQLNCGDNNCGDYNLGHNNIGNRNCGEFNVGNRNIGNYNVGDWNDGSWNVGNWNTGDFNAGYLNTIDAPIRIFNKETNVPRDQVVFPMFFNIQPVIFIKEKDATDTERMLHAGEIHALGGFLKRVTYRKAWRMSWDKASYEDRRKVLKLPNWDNEIFKEISGIDVEKELKINSNEKTT